MASGRPASGTLRAHGLRKSFGGLHVTNDLSMEFTPGTISSIVGPNGAGKSTLFALLIGQYRPDAGSVHLNGQDVTRKKVFQRARAGLGIKRQVGSVFLDQTVAENLWLAAFSDTGNVSTASDRVQSMCAWLGLTSKASSPASALSHGQRQLLEIGMVLSAGPSVLLLDEPTAGMTRAETRTMAEAIRQMSQYCTVVVVEHDMEFIRELDAPVTVIHRGEVLAQGSIEDIRRNDEVLSVYLGRSHAETA
jgi:branched-chain amino acid transport system permease protein